MANIPISSFTAAANATGIGMSGFSLTGTNAQSMLDLAGTWNTSGTPTGIKINVTDTASNAASLLADLQVGGTSRFNVTKAGGGYFAGNVGIGTTNANSRLVVSDSAAIASLRVDTSNAGVSPSNYSEIVLSDINSPRAWWRNVRDGSGQTGFGYNNHLAFFSSAGSTPVERVRFDSSGNVGIGTNSPGALLDVNGTARAGNFRVNAGGSVTGAGMWGIDTILAFNTGSLERMRIDSAGNLGVGTSTPGYLVQVSSRISLGSDGVIQWGSALTGTSRGFLSWDTNIASINAASNLVLASNGTSERVRITAAGNVGIGTNAPGYQLHLGGDTVGAITGSLALGNVAGTPSALVQGFRGAGGDFAGSLLFSTTTGPGVVTERMRISSVGDVGIGTASPTHRLSVTNGDIRVNTSAAEAVLRIRQDAASADFQLRQDASSNFILALGASERMRIDSAGNVLVGKTAAGVGTDGAQLIAAGFSGFSAPGTTALFLNRNTSDGTILEFGRNGVSAATMGLTSSALTVSTAGTERMRVKSTGQVRFVPLASAPAGAEAGDVYYDSTTNKLRCYNGTIWNDLF